MTAAAFQVTLYLGFLVTPDFASLLDSITPEKMALFVKKDDPLYLNEMHLGDKRYLGKFVGDVVHTDALVTLEANIYSLLKKLVPEYPYEKEPLVLIPVEIPSI